MRRRDLSCIVGNWEWWIWEGVVKRVESGAKRRKKKAHFGKRNA